MTITGRDGLVPRIMPLARVHLEGRCEGRDGTPNLLALSKLFASREGAGRQDDGHRHPWSRAGGVESQGQRRPAVGVTTRFARSGVPYIAGERHRPLDRVQIVNQWPVIGNADIAALEDGQDARRQRLLDWLRKMLVSNGPDSGHRSNQKRSH